MLILDRLPITYVSTLYEVFFYDIVLHTCEIRA